MTIEGYPELGDEVVYYKYTDHPNVHIIVHKALVENLRELSKNRNPEHRSIILSLSDYLVGSYDCIFGKRPVIRYVSYLSKQIYRAGMWLPERNDELALDIFLDYLNDRYVNLDKQAKKVSKESIFLHTTDPKLIFKEYADEI